MDDLCKLNVLGVERGGSRTGFCSLLLESVVDQQRLQIVIGTAEANAIECSIRGITPPRPLTQDIMARTMECFGLKLVKVVLYILSGEIFGAKLIIASGLIERDIDARSSDGIALALRLNAPIYATRETMEKAVHPDSSISSGSIFRQRKKSVAKPNVGDTPKGGDTTDDLMRLSVRELEEMLRRCVANEQYEKASLIKQVIKRKNTPQ